MRYWHWPNGSGLGGSGLVVRKEFIWSGNPDVSCWALFFLLSVLWKVDRVSGSLGHFT